jgi:hypothetical protein
MGEHRKIVVEHYPAGRLPDELRPGIDADSTVRVTVEAEQEGTRTRALKPLLGSGPGAYSEEEAVTFIRRLRDE